ncbi:MAG: hypothetical protein JXA03_09500 [Bacteroidales bacterium]|nr:hypothetical protein [Bacteroidales bacterium]
MTGIIRAGFLQFNPELGNVAGNIQKIEALLNGMGNADILVIPELPETGYNFRDYAHAFSLARELSRSVYLEFLVAQSRKRDVFIISGLAEKEGRDLYNTSVLVCPVRGLAGKYRKVHLFMNEKNIFRPGNLGFPVFDIGICKTAMLICFDWMFPEAWRIVALRGAELICHPSNLVLPFAQQAVPVHAMINRVFVVTANRTGTERGITFSGRSFISGPSGETLAMAAPQSDEVTLVELDLSLAHDKMITPLNHAFDDRMPEEYLPLSDPGQK